MPPDSCDGSLDPKRAYDQWRSGPFMRDAQSGNLTAGILTAIGLCEALRQGDEVLMNADEYFASQDGLRNHNSLVLSGLLAHDVIGSVTDRAKLPYGFAALGRRSNRRRLWAQPLVDAVIACGIHKLPQPERSEAIRVHFQVPLADEARAVVEARPIARFCPELTLDENVRQALAEARRRNAIGHVAQVMVAAKLIVRYELPEDHFSERGLSGSSADRQRSGDDRSGDLEVGDLVFEVAHSTPNDDHLDKARARWNSAGFTLIVPDEHLESWRRRLRATHVDALAGVEAKLDARIKLRGIVQFISQNIDECAGLSIADHAEKFRDYFRLYNRLMRNEDLHVEVVA